MNPKLRRNLAVAGIPVTLAGWAASALWWAKDEPQFVLGLSWLAITLTCVDIAATTDVRSEQEDK